MASQEQSLPSGKSEEPFVLETEDIAAPYRIISYEELLSKRADGGVVESGREVESGSR